MTLSGVAVALGISAGDLSAQAPLVRHADADFEASGYVTPAGMVPPSMYHGAVMPVGYSNSGSCDGGYCGGGCDSYGNVGPYGNLGCDSCGGNCGPMGCGGLLGKYLDEKRAGLSPLRHCCLFCAGHGCSACQCIGQGQILGLLRCLLPYREAGLCAQRWYDLSAEAIFLTHNSGINDFAVTSLGVDGPRVLRTGDADSGGDLELGMRLSAAMICGAGGNLEGIYMGNNSWSSSAAVSDDTFNLFSFISDFGTDPPDNAGTPEFDAGFDDTDRSRRQSVATNSEFHSAELNYRRRTVGPYCRFQGSWLVGLRYLKFDNALIYSALGDNDNTVNANLPRFFSSNDEVQNQMWGPQAGFDLWWNVIPGVNVGFGMKGAWVQNDVNHRTILTANSLILPGATAGTIVGDDTTHDTTVIGELEAKLVYRFTHSWSIRSAYYLVAVEDAGFSTIDSDTIRNFIDPANNPNASLDLVTDDLVLQGFSFGTEFIW